MNTPDLPISGAADPGPEEQVAGSGSRVPFTIELCLRQLFTSQLPTTCPDWPPDAFAVASCILELTGAYSQVVSAPWPPDGSNLEDWTDRIHRLGISWFARRRCPAEVQEWWNVVIADRNVLISEITTKPNDHRLLITALLQISAAADESCSGFGIQGAIDYDLNITELKDSFLMRAEVLLGKYNNLCEAIEPSAAKVVPKVQTPQLGFNLRSLTHNIALWRHPEVSPKCVPYPFKANKSISLLLVPWPYRVSPCSFRPVESTGVMMPDCFQFFDYSADDVDSGKLVGMVSKLLDQSCRVVDCVDAVVFPELALTERAFDHLARYLAERNILLISGIAGVRKNSAKVAFPFTVIPERYREYEQNKHHRWKLDRNQIVQYSLGSTLGTDCAWWEHIPLKSREVNFYQLNDWLNACVLICEDLARQDPVSTLIRAVGPNLVVALLMDGPQMRGRWADRYASVLADDPGSSVLTFTSIGMAERCKPRSTWDCPSTGQNIIALWRDSIDGTSEIRLEPESGAVVISLNTVVKPQYTADGRVAEYARHSLILSGVHQLTGSREL